MAVVPSLDEGNVEIGCGYKLVNVLEKRASHGTRSGVEKTLGDALNWWHRNHVFRFGMRNCCRFFRQKLWPNRKVCQVLPLQFLPSLLSVLFLFCFERGSDIVQDSYKFATVSGVTWSCDHQDPLALVVHIPCHGPPHWTLSLPLPVAALCPESL